MQDLCKEGGPSVFTMACDHNGRTNPAFLLVEGLGLFFVLIVGHAILEQPYRQHLHLPLQQTLMRLPDWSAVLKLARKWTVSASHQDAEHLDAEGSSALQQPVDAASPVSSIHVPRPSARSTKEPCRSVPTQPPLIEFIGANSSDSKVCAAACGLHLGSHARWACTTPVPWRT